MAIGVSLTKVNKSQWCLHDDDNDDDGDDDYDDDVVDAARKH